MTFDAEEKALGELLAALGAAVVELAFFMVEDGTQVCDRRAMIANGLRCWLGQGLGKQTCQHGLFLSVAVNRCLGSFEAS